MDNPDMDMPLADALVTIRNVAALIEEIGAYCPRCGGVLFDGARHCCDLISAVKDESGATATANGDGLQAPDSTLFSHDGIAARRGADSPRRA